MPSAFLNAKNDEDLPDSENIWAFIEGSEKTDEISYITIEDFRKFFNFYKISMFLQKKLKSMGGFKLCLSFKCVSIW